MAKNTGTGDFVWILDYHLMLTADLLDKLGVKRRTGFFLHIPFPPLDRFLKLPWKSEILNSLLKYNLIGSQTIRDRRKFLRCVKALVKVIKISGK